MAMGSCPTGQLISPTREMRREKENAKLPSEDHSGKSPHVQDRPCRGIRRANHGPVALFYLKHRLARCLQADRKRSISQSVVPRQDLPCQDHGGLGQGEGSPPSWSCSPFLDRSRFLCVDSTQHGLSILGADRYTARPVKLRITAGRQNSCSAAVQLVIPW